MRYMRAGEGRSRSRRLLGALALSICLSVGCLGPLAGPAGADDSEPGEITYGLISSSDAFGPSGDVMVVKPAPDATPRAVGGPKWSFRAAPSWSPSGRRIAFISRGTTPSFAPTDLWVIDRDGTDPRQLTATPDQWEAFPDWSPNGAAIAYAVGPPVVWAPPEREPSEIWVWHMDGSDPTRISPPGAHDHYPAWSPDGQRLAFSRDGDIYVTTVATGATRRLTFNGNDNIQPAWSRDGRTIAYSGRVMPYVDFATFRSVEIFTVDARGGTPRRLTFNDELDRAPSWSPDGTSLAFERDVFMGSWWDPAIWMMRRDGTHQARITWSGGDPDWR